MTRPSDRRVLITGGTQGIGRACAERFAADGDEVLLTYSRDDAAADAAVRAIHAAGGRASAHKADLGDRAALAGLWQAVDGAVDVLILNAAYQRKADMDATDWALMERTLRVNVVGNCELAQRYIAHRRELGAPGAIVVHSSNQGQFVNPTGFAYGVSKAALNHLVEHLAAACAGDGIRVNGVVLGWFDTEGERRFYGGDRIEGQAAAAIPLGRIGDPAEAATFTHFLASDANSYMTGSLLRCDGGFHLAPDLST